MSSKKQAAYLVCQRWAEILVSKGLKAYFGRDWTGECDHRNDREFWYFHPTNDGGVGAYVSHDGAYDQGLLGPDDLAAVQTALASLPFLPTRRQVWQAWES